MRRMRSQPVSERQGLPGSRAIGSAKTVFAASSRSQSTPGRSSGFMSAPNVGSASLFVRFSSKHRARLPAGGPAVLESILLIADRTRRCRSLACRDSIRDSDRTCRRTSAPGVMSSTLRTPPFAGVATISRMRLRRLVRKSQTPTKRPHVRPKPRYRGTCRTNGGAPNVTTIGLG
jgi:hypothetical protein